MLIFHGLVKGLSFGNFTLKCYDRWNSIELNHLKDFLKQKFYGPFLLILFVPS